MTVSTVNCCLCGAPIEVTEEWPRWMGSFRAVCVVNKQWREAFISGVGERLPHADQVPNPLRQESSNANKDQDTDEILQREYMQIHISSIPFGDGPTVGSRPLWGFPFHCSCWDLFNADRKAHGKPPYNPQALFEVLMSFPRDNLTDFGHNYGGVADYGCRLDLEAGQVVQGYDQFGPLLPGEKSTFKLAYNRTNSTILDIQKQDPMYNAEIRSVFETEDSSADLTFGPPPDMRQEENCAEGNDMFREFPYGILWSILSHLSQKDFFNLRRSSRVFRHMFIPEVYWRSRFLPQKKLECVFDALDDHTYDRKVPWSIAYQRLMYISRNASLKNRRRVWKLSRTLGNLHDEAAEIRGGTDTILSQDIEHHRGFWEGEGSDLAWAYAGGYLRMSNQSFAAGARVLQFQDGFFPADMREMRVSSVDHLDKSYVCGLSWGWNRGQLGHVRHRKGDLLFWRHQPRWDVRIVGFHLALDQHGIRGLCAVSANNKLSNWSGCLYGLPKKRLMLYESPDDQEDLNRQEPPRLRIIRFKAGLDALKLVFLSSPFERPLITDTSTPSTPSLIDTALWYPDIPPLHCLFSGIGVQDLGANLLDQQQTVLSTLIFGGENGEQMKHVTHLIVFSQEENGIMGLEVMFDCLIDGENKMSLGVTKTCGPIDRQTPPTTMRKWEMLLEGSAGEEITGLEVHQRQYVLGLKIRTNCGQAVEFPPPDESGRTMRDRASDDDEIRQVCRPPLCKVVGFLAKAGPRGIQKFGLVHVSR